MDINDIELSKKLISCKSITPNDGGAFDIIEKTLEGLGFECNRYIYSEKGFDNVENLYARFGNKQPNLAFAGHVDVVPPGAENLWNSNPFNPVEKDGKLYGRGASDMKCAIACFIDAVAKFIHNNKDFGSISFLLTADEEGCGINGTKKLLKTLSDKGEVFDGCIVGEPTSSERIGDIIKIGRRGSVTFNILVMGKQGHVAYPSLADNPITKLVNVLNLLKQNKLDEGTEFFDPSNLEIVNIDVNNNTENVIPEIAKATFNIRFNDKYDSKTLIKWVESLFDSVFAGSDTKYDIKHRVSGESFFSGEGKLSNIVKKSVNEITGNNPILSTTGGTSDARFIKDYCKVVELGHLNQTAHKIDENVAIADITTLSKIYLQILNNYFQ